jgi:hypothetical protein
VIQFSHINIITGDWKKLASFYIEVFKYKTVLPERDLKGNWLDRATNIDNAHLTGIHLALPGYTTIYQPLKFFSTTPISIIWLHNQTGKDMDTLLLK